MSKFNVVPFSEAPFQIIDGDRGKNYPKRSEFRASGHCVFLSAANVTKTGFDFSECQFIDRKRDAALNKGRLERGDIVLTTRGTIGNAAYFNDSVKFNHLRINSGMVILRCDRSKILPAFLYHFVRSPDFTSQADGLRSGVAQPQLPIRDMRRIKIPLPSILVQRRVASILSAYDDLIENNTRRIEILEEMARRLYEEWFVHFRFPGHEGVKFKESELGMIPDDWECNSLQNYIELAYGKALKKEDRQPGPYPVYGSSGEVGTHDEFLVKGPGIVLGRKGNVGSVFWTQNDFYPIDTVYYVKTTLPLEYVFFNLKGQRFLNNDAAVPGLNRNQAYSLPFLKPGDELLEQFTNHCGPIYDLVRKLQAKNQNLRAQRDLLLPKLISGEIDLSNLPMPDDKEIEAA